MKSKRNLKRNKKSKKTIKGGAFWSSNKVAPNPYPGQCDINQIDTLTDTNDMKRNYQTCCPKGFFGKNSSAYCKQLDAKYQTSMTNENNMVRQYKYETPAAQLPQHQYDTAAALKKPWYKFWGGKKSKKIRNKKRNQSRRH